MSKMISRECAAEDCSTIYQVKMIPAEEPSVYCSMACKRRAKRHRTTQRDQAGIPRGPAETPPQAEPKIDLRDVGRCPHPFKRVFRTEDEAYTTILQVNDMGMTPYWCVCGARHIGHPSTPSNKRAARRKFNAWLKRQGAGHAGILDTDTVQGSIP